MMLVLLSVLIEFSQIIKTEAFLCYTCSTDGIQLKWYDLFPNAKKLFFDDHLLTRDCLNPQNGLLLPGCNDACFQLKLHTTEKYYAQFRYALGNNTARGCWGEFFNNQLDDTSAIYCKNVTSHSKIDEQEAPLILEWCFCRKGACNGGSEPNIETKMSSITVPMSTEDIRTTKKPMAINSATKMHLQFIFVIHLLNKMFL